MNNQWSASAISKWPSIAYKDLNVYGFVFLLTCATSLNLFDYPQTLIHAFWPDNRWVEFPKKVKKKKLGLWVKWVKAKDY